MRVIAIGQQGRDIVISDKPDVAAVAAIAAIRTAFGHHGFAAERHAAGSAITTTEIDRTFVDELALAHQMILVERLVIAGVDAATRHEASRAEPGHLADLANARCSRR